MSLKIESEVKVDSDPCVSAWDDGKLFVGLEDGSIKVFDENLTPISSWPAHGAQLFALAAGNGYVYSSSNDGGIRVWTAKGEKVTELPSKCANFGVLRVYGKELYAGDEEGNVVLYRDHTECATYNVIEEVKDLQFCAPFLYTVRDLDVTVTEIKPDESTNLCVTMHTMEGRAPMRLAGSRLVVVARSGKDLVLYETSIHSECKQLHTVKASDMIITSLTVSGDYVQSGGWDGVVRRWKISGDKLEPSGELTLGSCVNTICATSANNSYAAVAGGITDGELAAEIVY